MTRGRSTELEGRGTTPTLRSSISTVTASTTQPTPGSTTPSTNTSTSTTTGSTTNCTTTTSSTNASRPSTLSDLYRTISTSRSRSRHRHHRRRHSRFRCKRRETNFPSAVCNMLVMVLLCSGMAEPQWFYMRGGGCCQGDDSPVHYIGISKFFPVGHFIGSVGPQESQVHTVYNYGPSSTDILVNCVSPGSVEIIRSVIALCFVAIAFSLTAFLLDLAGPSGSIYRILHRNAVFSILTVITCVTINGFSYWVASRLEHLQHATKLHKGSRVEVQFSVSFYLVSTAGAAAVVATACNLLRRYPPDHHDDRQQLIDNNDMDGGDPNTFGSDITGDIMASMAAPPAYSP